MIRSVLLKNLLINSVFSVFSCANKVIPKDDRRILLYSDNRFSDNLLYLYQYMTEKGLQKEYQIICAAKTFENIGHRDPRVQYISPEKAVFEYMKCGHVFYCFGKIPICPTTKQCVIQMWHGTSFKGFAENQVRTNSRTKQFYTYVYASSEYFVPIVERKFSVPRENVCICGHPRTDVFYGADSVDYGYGDCSKLIVWLPTFRSSRKLGMKNGDQSIIVPVLKADEVSEFNDFLRDRGVKVLVKLHPAQDIDRSVWKPASNFIVLPHDEFVQKKIDLYALLKQADGMITDYSSVIYDYLLLDRPIGFTEDDIGQYTGNRGFAVDDPDRFRPGMRIRTLDDLKSFVGDIADDRDSFAKARRDINNLSNQYQDGKNCERSLKLSGIRIPE